MLSAGGGGGGCVRLKGSLEEEDKIGLKTKSYTGALLTEDVQT